MLVVFGQDWICRYILFGPHNAVKMFDGELWFSWQWLGRLNSLLKHFDNLCLMIVAGLSKYIFVKNRITEKNYKFWASYRTALSPLSPSIVYSCLIAWYTSISVFFDWSLILEISVIALHFSYDLSTFPFWEGSSIFWKLNFLFSTASLLYFFKICFILF